MEISFEGPAILVADINASRVFYELILEQEFVADYGPNVVFKGFSIWQADHAHQCIFGARAARNAGLAHDNFELYFETEELEKAYGKIQTSWQNFLGPIEVQPWGQRTFRMRDPDGHLVELAEPLPVLIKRLLGEGQTPEQVAEKTSIALEFIQSVANQE